MPWRELLCGWQIRKNPTILSDENCAPNDLANDIDNLNDTKSIENSSQSMFTNNFRFSSFVVLTFFENSNFCIRFTMIEIIEVNRFQSKSILGELKCETFMLQLSVEY